MRKTAVSGRDETAENMFLEVTSGLTKTASMASATGDQRN